MSEITITATFLSNIKKEAKKLKKELHILHTDALERVARKYDFTSYHALQRRYEYVKTQGNRGKQLNPNQKSSLLIAILENTTFRIDNNKPWGDFQSEFVEKGFMKQIGARQLGRKEVDDKGLVDAYGIEPLDVGSDKYMFFEFTKNDSSEWSYQEACDHLKSKIDMKAGNVYDGHFWIDDKAFFSHHYSDDDENLKCFIRRKSDFDEDPYDPPSYCPAIDGYHDVY